MTDTTELDEAATRARCDAATGGPWRAAEQSDREWWGIQSEHFALASVFDRPNAEFIAHARTDLPAALDENERLRAALDEARIRANDWMGAAAARGAALRAAEQERDEAMAEAIRQNAQMLTVQDERDEALVSICEHKAAMTDMRRRKEAAESALAAVLKVADEFDEVVGFRGAATAIRKAAALATPTSPDGSAVTTTKES